MSRPSLALALLIPLTAPPAARAADPKADAELVRTAQAMFTGLRTTTLPNGLRVYLLPVKGAPVVSTMVAYRVGSGDEEKDQTGLSHYLEHLMFKGTEKLSPGDIDRLTQRNGGQNNAYTNEDMTVYHFDFAADRWAAALEVEADRMRNLRIDEKHEFQQEKGAVIAELERNEDTPGDLELKAILPLLYPKDSPYSHPVIGQREHVRGATAEIIKRHYDKWYHPNNASLVIVGGFDPDDALARVVKLFGPIPKADLPPRKKATAYEDRAGPVRKEFESKFEAPRMIAGFNTTTVGDPDDPVLDFVQHILADGRTSRLYRRLVEDERLASSVDAANSTGRYPGWFSVSLDLLKGKDRKKAEELVLAELEKLAAEPVSDAELARARRKLLAGFVFSRESVHSLADRIAQVSAYPAGEDVAKYYRDYLDRVLAVTKDDIRAAAKKYLTRKQAAVVWSVPKEAAGAGEPQAQARGFLKSHPVAKANPVARAPGSPGTARQAGGPASDFSLKDARRVVLPNGLVLIMLEDHRVPIVVGRASVADVRLREPAEKAGVAALAGGLLQEGTDKHSGKEIAALIEDTGGSFSVASSGGSFKVLTPDTKLALGLLFECLTRPTFPADAFERKRDQQLTAIDDLESQPDTKAAMLFKATVYGKHPFGRPSLGKKETVEKLTADDCRAFHKLAFAPNFTTVVLVGDFKADEGLEEERRPEAGARGPAEAGRAEHEDRQRPDRRPGPRLPRAPRRHPQQPRLLPAGGDGLRARHRGRVHRPALVHPAGPTGAGVHRHGGYHRVGRHPAGHLHRLHRHVPGQVPVGPRRVPQGDHPAAGRAADQTGGRGREEVPAREPAVPVHDPVGGGRRAAGGRAVRAGVRLPGEVPQGGRGGDARAGAGRGAEVPRPEAAGGDRRRPDRPGRQAAGEEGQVARRTPSASAGVGLRGKQPPRWRLGFAKTRTPGAAPAYRMATTPTTEPRS